MNDFGIFLKIIEIKEENKIRKIFVLFDNFKFILLKLGYGSSAGEESKKSVLPVSRQEIEASYTVSEYLNIKFLIQGETRNVSDATSTRSHVKTNLSRVFKVDNLILVPHFSKPIKRTRGFVSHS
jgi:hypothetical protein